MVGISAYKKSLIGLIPSGPNESFSIPKPAGLGALAITVKPPPATAPATKEYLEALSKCSSIY